MTKIHLISGATSGIGAAIAARLSARGDEVIPLVRSSAQAAALNVPRSVICDLAQPEQVKAAIASFDVNVDSFINCAAAVTGKSAFETSPADAAALFNVNLISPMVICGGLKKNLRPGSAIMLFSSQSAYKGGYDDAYNASKGGINTLIKSLAMKYAPDVRVLGVAPGITLETRMTRERRADDLGRLRDTIPLKRFGNVDEIAELVECMLGPAGAYITGAVIDVNGGNYLR